ncbi:SDR family NAD(P)-dependent oxidoreductase [Hyphomonas sp. ND6WE1B]|uniref:SDR family NAD(P)-dependent oxidoreductase n=1 Tax=Hyphomonas sp. ND6WE1B TaxID=1848191 RepID=UPI000807600F|nr:SDR family NAD(P)-dependent oxidoreductase [Hyphomonas sp. ND6WE1B]
MQVKGKCAVITGGASGLGASAARHFVECGAKVALFDVNDELGAEICDSIGRGAASFFKVDVTDDRSVAAAIAQVVEKYEAIHINLNAAGIPAPFKILERDGAPADITKFTRAVTVNLVGVFNVMSKCAAIMARNVPERGEERGVIINVSSGAAYEGQVGQCGYASSKAGVIGLNLPAARELGDIGIRVNAIAPGLFRTPMVESLGDKVISSLIDMIEAPKRLGDMREFSELCRFIVENAYLNGETIRLDAATRLRAR